MLCFGLSNGASLVDRVDKSCSSPSRLFPTRRLIRSRASRRGNLLGCSISRRMAVWRFIFELFWFRRGSSCRLCRARQCLDFQRCSKVFGWCFALKIWIARAEVLTLREVGSSAFRLGFARSLDKRSGRRFCEIGGSIFQTSRKTRFGSEPEEGRDPCVG